MNDKSILEKALLQVQQLEEAVKQNAKGILESTMKQELKDLLKESEEEECEDETLEKTKDVAEVEDTEDDVADDEETTDDADEDETEDGTEDEFSSFNADGDDSEDVGMDDSEDDMEDSEDDDLLDMTNSSDEEVLKVFKSMKPEDGIVVKKDGDNVNLTTGDDEYIIQLDDEDEDVTDSLNEDETEDVDNGNVIVSDLSSKRSGHYVHALEVEDVDQLQTAIENLVSEFVETYSPEDIEEFFDTISIHALNDENEQEIYDFDVNGFVKEKIEDVSYDDADFSDDVDSEDETGDDEDEDLIYEIELDGEGSDDDYEWFGEFADDADEVASDDEEGVELDAQEAARTFANDVRRPANQGMKFKAGRKDINEAEKTIAKLKSENKQYKEALVEIKGQLDELALFNANLAYTTKLFTENTTTKKEKLEILKRFDKVKSISDSKNLFESIETELKSQKTVVSESLNKFTTTNHTPRSSSTKMLSESKVYENSQFSRIKELMFKVNK